MADTSPTKTVLGTDCRIKGELYLEGDLQLHGECSGMLHVGGTLDIRETAMVRGLARAGAVRVSGRVEADLVGEQGIALLEGCRVTGRLFAARLLAVKGASLRGEVCIGPDAMAEAPGLPLGHIAAQGSATIDATRDESIAAAFEQVDGTEHGAMMRGPQAKSAAASENEFEPVLAAEVAPPVVSVAAALDDADDQPLAELAKDSLASQAAPTADVSTVPSSIRAVLERRPRLSSVSSASSVSNRTSSPRRSA